MADIRGSAAAFLIALGAVCGFIWLISNQTIALIALSLGLLGYLFYHIFWLNQLYQWFKNPNIKTIPEGYAIWEDVFTALLQYERSNIANQAQLNSAVERFNLTANAIPDGLLILGASNEIEWCTHLAESQLGLNLDTDRFQPIVNLLRDSHFIAYLYNQDYSTPFKLKSWRDSELIYEIHLIPLASGQKLLICRDTTQLEKVDAMRRDFIANVSHELRTPLTVVGGFLETLSDMEGAVPEAIKNYFNMMQHQTGRMGSIIEDLLTLSAIESDTEAPEDHEIEMSSLLTQVKNDTFSLSQSLGKKKIQVHLDVDASLNLNGAQDELLSAFTNLCSNAVRYTPDGGDIVISWHLVEKQPVFAVRDTGIGIEPQHIERLTERFYRVDRSRSRETGGTGLGLSIVKHILIRHLAKLEITSEVGTGSTFSIVFPASRAIVNS